MSVETLLWEIMKNDAGLLCVTTSSRSVAVVDAGAPSVGGCLRPGAIIRCRPVGALVMEDEAGGDEKLLAVPIEALHPFYTGIRSYRDLPAIMCQQIAHFFQHYKDLEKGKWVTIVKWLDVEGAEELIVNAIERGRLASS